MTDTTPITVAYGDGTGPEMMEASLHILQEAGAAISIESIEVGERIYKQGAKDGLLPSALPLLMRTGVLLMGPITVPMHTKCEPLELSLCHRFELTRSSAFEHVFDLPASDDRITLADYGTQTIGERFALFSSTSPVGLKEVGKNTGNPSAMLQAAMLMLQHIGQTEVANRIFSAWHKTLADGVHTKDIHHKRSSEKAGTREFAEAVVARL